jgi:hypothetical protein
MPTNTLNYPNNRVYVNTLVTGIRPRDLRFLQARAMTIHSVTKSFLHMSAKIYVQYY